MKTIKSFALATLTILISSCSTYLSIGTIGSESITMPPYDKYKSVNIAASIQAGVSTGFQPLVYAWIFPYSTYIQGNLILQFPNVFKTKFYIANTISPWIGNFNYNDQEEPLITDMTGDFYGATLTCRLGYKTEFSKKIFFTPSVEISYSYENGSFFDERIILNNQDPQKFTNSNPLSHNFILSFIPFDLTVSSSTSYYRLNMYFGWNYPSIVYQFNAIQELKNNNADFEEILEESLPVKFGYSFSYCPKNEKVYGFVNLTMYSNYILDTVSYYDTNCGISLGFGYLF